GWRGLAGGVAGLAAGFMLLPVVALILAVHPAELYRKLADPMVRQALGLSIATSAASVLIVIAAGLPVAWWHASGRSRTTRWFETLLVLPLVLPPTVAGLGLLLAFGRAGVLGKAISALGVSIPFTPVAVIIAQVFVGFPYFALAGAAGLRRVDAQLLEVGATLGHGAFGVFRRIALPLAMPSLLAGAVMAWARGLGEFGATITFAGNLPGKTQTLPLAVYAALQQDLDAALAVAVLLLAISAGVLIAVRAWIPVSFGTHARRPAP
ncbi:MAG TPA: ABC transporter permease, partial [Gemmatimonadales bacterium]|nr:ABC transporter permease [Gemmatimonadales bacterium]